MNNHQSQSSENPKRSIWNLSSSTLHLIAMFCMLLDHVWANLMMQYKWMTCVGRIAFPIFAFLLVEGFVHTHNMKKYILRMAGFAVISEIPFNLMYGGIPIYPYHQNVLWLFVLALLALWGVDTVRQKGKWWLTVLVAIPVIGGSYVLSIVTAMDFCNVGIVTVFLFYFFRGTKWWCYAGQLLGMYYLNVEVMGGYYYPVTIMGHDFELMQQGFALLALVPIWLYRGRQGMHSKVFQYCCYAFYPVHILILAILLLM